LVQDRVVYKLDKFTEKPKLSLAKIFTRSSSYYWNANQYVWRADSILLAFKRYQPDIYKSLVNIYKSLGTSTEKTVVGQEYEKMPKISIDYAISEKAKNFLLVVAKYDWTDVGDWNEVWKNLPKDNQGNVILDGDVPGGRVINLDTSNALIQTDGRLVAIIDVDDVVVIDTSEILLVCKKSQAQNVKKIVEQLKKEKKKEYL
jgi:mannose-1-phosphate guanylyltransferase